MNTVSNDGMKMSSKRALLFKVLINRFHSGEEGFFLEKLPQEEAQAILKQSTPSADLSVAFSWTTDLLTRTHYSWLAPVIKKLPSSLQKSVVAAFPEKQSSALKNFLKMDFQIEAQSASTKNFLIDQFYRHWPLEGVIPYQYLSSTPLNPLLNLTKTELVELIDFLALYDVAEAVRHIVDKNKLTTIYRCLSPKKQQFLHSCLYKKERIAAPKLNIEKWDGDPEKFGVILHRRGMIRLSKALCGQTPSFLWHIVHLLDIGRGTVISENYQELEVPAINPFLRLQVLYIIDFLKKHKSAA